jgi:reverse gyrase
MNDEMKEKVYAIFKFQCPNCDGDITDLRLKLKVPCNKCIPLEDEEILKQIRELNEEEALKRIIEYLEKHGRIGKYKEIRELELKAKEVEELFKKANGSRFWSAQRTWCKRALRGKSFAIIAPTGMGKTSFGIIYSIYLAKNGKKSYIILPTSLLAQQVHQIMEQYRRKLELDNIKIAAYYALLTEKEKREMMESISKGNYDILITTSYFLSRNYDAIANMKFNMIFVDDVDSFVRRSKNVDLVLKLLGISDEEIKEAYERIEGKSSLNGGSLSKARDSILIVSGASIRSRKTKKIKLIRELLGFEISGRIEGYRNIVDVYIQPRGGRDLIDEAVRVIKELGSGGLIFIPVDKGMEYVKKVTETLNNNGIRAAASTQARRKLLEKFRSGEYDVLVGIASYRSPLTRGIDLPETVKYAVFVGVPKIRISLDISEFRSYKAIMLLSSIREHVKTERDRNLIDEQIAKIKRYFATVGEEELIEIIEAMKSDKKLEGYKGFLQQIINEAMKLMQDYLSRSDIKRSIEKSPYLDIEEEGKLTIIVPDVVTYIQASGRTSRLYAGGVSKGLAVTIIDNKKAFNGLARNIKWYLEDVEFTKYNKLQIKKLIKEISDERVKIREIREGKITGEIKDIVKTALLVVESPKKASTIARFFGTPHRRMAGALSIFEVSTGDYMLNIASTAGHVFDLTTQDGYYGVIVKNEEMIPVYDTIKRCIKCGKTISDSINICNACGGELYDKKEIVDALKSIAREVDLLIIATDDDSEGEKIGWDIAQVLSPYVKEIKRMRFHEVTPRAIREALQNLGEINMGMVEAQLLRRIEDRWIGFELSKKVQINFGRRELSAGRVQTPVLGWVVNSTKELKENIVDMVEITLQNDRKITVIMEKTRKNELAKILKDLESSDVEVVKLEEIEEELNPKPPYTTDALLKDSSEMLGLGASRTMSIAQDLFELGLITYHRTSSTRVSNVGMKVAQDYISEKWGANLYYPRRWGAEGAHECIRPTRPIDVSRLRYLIASGIMRLGRKLTRDHYDLYDLIFKRFIASQMKPAKILREKAIINVATLKKTVSTDEVVEVIDEGFTLISPIRTMPKLYAGKIRVKSVRSWRTSLKPLFTEGELVMQMKERGIGRPSTYAHIISTLFERGYIKTTTKKGKLIATSLGSKVFNYLISNYSKYVCEETTRKLEELMDEVEEGKANYTEILRELYEEMMELATSTPH